VRHSPTVSQAGSLGLLLCQPDGLSGLLPYEPDGRGCRGEEAYNRAPRRERGKAPRSPASQTNFQRIHMIEPALALDEQMNEAEHCEADHDANTNSDVSGLAFRFGYAGCARAIAAWRVL